MMIDTLRPTRTAAFVLLALALAAGAASLRIASLTAPGAAPAIGGPAELKAPEGSGPVQMPTLDVQLPAAPATVPALDPEQRAAPPATADGFASGSSTTPSSGSGTMPANGSGTMPANGSGTMPANGSGTAPSRWSEWVNDTPPAYLAPAQTFSKRPLPANGE